MGALFYFFATNALIKSICAYKNRLHFIVDEIFAPQK
jgi:hypothetical protein